MNIAAMPPVFKVGRVSDPPSMLLWAKGQVGDLPYPGRREQR